MDLPEIVRCQARGQRWRQRRTLHTAYKHTLTFIQAHTHYEKQNSRPALLWQPVRRENFKEQRRAQSIQEAS